MEDDPRERLPAQYTFELAYSALEHIRDLHRRVNSEPTLATRVRRGFRRATANRWRVQRWPGSFLEGLRDKRSFASDLTDLGRLAKQNRLDQALVVAAAQLPSSTEDSQFLATARDVFMRTGSVSLEARALKLLREVNDSKHLQRRERRVLNHIQETDPDWLPRVSAHGQGRTAPKSGRVLHLLKASVPYRQSGYTMRTRYLLDGQRAMELEPIVITALGFPEDIGTVDFPNEEDVEGISYHHLRKPEGVDTTSEDYLDTYASEVARLVATLNPSLIHVHSGHRGYEAALVGRAVAESFDLPLVYEVRGFFESLWSPDPAWNERGELFWRRRETEARCMNAADAVVTLSETMKAEIVDRGIASEKVFVVPNGVDPDRFYPATRDVDLVASLGLEGDLVFGYVSNLDHYREGQELLVDAASLLRDVGINAKALIIGDGRRRNELESLAEEKGIRERILFTGQVPHHQVLAYYRLLDVFVVPRVDERAARLVSPLKPFEAMAAGVPILVSDLPALSELIGSDRGMRFASGDSQALATALAELWSKPDMRRSYAEAARAWVLSERLWSDLAARYASVYEVARNGR